MGTYEEIEKRILEKPFEEASNILARKRDEAIVNKIIEDSMEKSSKEISKKILKQLERNIACVQKSKATSRQLFFRK